MTTWPPPPAWKAQRRGLRMPDDLSVVGFDDAPIAASIWPSLTTIRQPFDQMTQRAITAFGAWNANEALGKTAARSSPSTAW
jgi:LacI family transcriptional regulator